MAIRVVVDPITGRPFYWEEGSPGDRRHVERFLNHTKAKPLDKPLRHIREYNPEEP